MTHLRKETILQKPTRRSKGEYHVEPNVTGSALGNHFSTIHMNVIISCRDASGSHLIVDGWLDVACRVGRRCRCKASHLQLILGLLGSGAGAGGSGIIGAVARF
jgi:hypothetical protein